MANTFSKTYIDDVNFSKWYYSASGQHGSVPCNNPMERHNLAIKGSPNFFGYIEIGRDMYSCLTQEFVKLVYTCSTELTSPSSGLPVLDFKKATNNDQFMQFQSLLNDEVDIRQYGGGWLINDVQYLTEPITDDAVRKMEWAMAGVMEHNLSVNAGEDIRDVLLQRTMRFHFVKESQMSSVVINGAKETYFECDCRQYYFHRWCFQSAYMQHRSKLKLLGERISNNGSSTSKQSRSLCVTRALNAARNKLCSNKKRALPSSFVQEQVQGPCVQEPIPLTQDDYDATL
jgi:hypothetical protein